MAQLLTSELTSFTLDNMERFLCNTLHEALDSAAQTTAGRRRDFDVIVIGGGTFGAVVAEHLFTTDAAVRSTAVSLAGQPNMVAMGVFLVLSEFGVGSLLPRLVDRRTGDGPQ